MVNGKSEKLFQRITSDLANFPEEIIREWILPFAEDEGWPPEKSANPARWTRILKLDVRSWQKVVWKSDEIDISTMPLDVMGRHCLSEMQRCYLWGDENAYTTLKTVGNGGRRHQRAARYLLEHGVFPKPLILLADRKGELNVMDGNHRLLAWTSVHQWHKEFEKLSVEAKAEQVRRVGLPRISPLLKVQKVWIARQ